MAPALRVVATVDEPYASPCFARGPASCPRLGLEVEFIYTVLNGMLRFPVEFIEVKSYEEVEASLDTGEADIMGVTRTLSPESMLKWTASPVLYWDQAALLVREQEYQRDYTFFLYRAFNFKLWLGILATTLTVIAVQKCSKAAGKGLSLFCLRSPGFRETVNSLWFVAFAVCMELYSNLVTIDLVLVSEDLTPPFKDLDELAVKLNTKECRFVALNSYANGEDLLVANSSLDQSFAAGFRSAFITNPPLRVGSREEMGELIANSTYCYVGIDYVTLKAFYESRFCHMRLLILEDLPASSWVFYYNITVDGFRNHLNSVMYTDSVANYGDYLFRKYYSSPKQPKCPRAVSDWSALSMAKLVDCVWLMLFGGIALPCLALVCEKTHRWLALKRNQPSPPVQTIPIPESTSAKASCFCPMCRNAHTCTRSPGKNPSPPYRESFPILGEESVTKIGEEDGSQK